jgi:hypothetical protein
MSSMRHTSSIGVVARTRATGYQVLLEVAGL